MRSFRSKPVGWRYESNRHALSAKGIKSRYMAEQVTILKSNPQKSAQNKAEARKILLNVSEELLKTNAPQWRKQIRDEEVEKLKTSSQKSQNKVVRKRSDGIGPRSGVPSLRAERYLERETAESVLARRPINVALDQVEKGRFIAQVPYGRTFVSMEDLVSGKRGGLTPSEQQALRSAILARAIRYVREGGKESDLPQFVRSEIKVGEEARAFPGIFGFKKSETQAELAKVEKARKIAEESPAVSELKAYGRSKVVGAVESGVENLEAAPGRAIDFVEDVYGAKQEFHLGETQQFKGVGERIDEFDKSALFQTNAAIGNEEDGSFKFMNNEPKIQAKLEGREPSREQFGSVGGFFDNLTGLETGRPDSYAKKVENEVNSLFQAKHNLAEVDLTPFNKGTKAFKEGKREEVVKAVADLESEERKVKDRYTLVQKTWQKMLTENNQDSLFKDSRDSWSVLGADGGKKLADETEKLNDVKASLTKSASMVADRKYILKNRLGRMDANVPLETGAPQGRQITVVEDSNKKDVVTSLQKPGQVIEEVFEGRLS